MLFVGFALASAVAPAVLAQTAESPSSSPVDKLYSEARAAQTRGDLANAIAKYAAILRAAPRLGAAYNNLGALYLRTGEFRKAADILERGLKVDPTMSSASALLGVSLYELGEYGQARAPLEAALRANPKDDNAELVLAKCLMKLDDLEPAASHLRQLARRQPKNPEIFYLLGQVHMHLSEQALTQLNAIDPNSVYVHEMSGDLMASMQNYEGALTEYKKAVEMAPQQAGTHYKLGDAYWHLSEWDAATRQFQAELANDPNNCLAQWKVGNILLEQRVRPESALADTEKALAHCPQLTDARLDRARALMQIGRNEEALPELLAVRQVSPQEPRIHFLLGQVYRSLGKPQESQAEMNIFSELEEKRRAASAERARQVIENKENPH